MSDILQSKNIYCIPVGKEFEFEDDNRVFLVYSPLSSKTLLMSASELADLKSNLADSQSSSVLAMLACHSYPANRKGYHANYKDCTTLYVLPNQKCNFRCAYCYSAKGRSDVELTFEQIQTMFEYFFSLQRCAERTRRIMFVGGGEPFLSWNLIIQSIFYAEKLAEENEIDLHITITTNASLLNDERISFVKGHAISLKCSFDILPELQNRQRQDYDLVASNLSKVLDAGISTNIQATITPGAVPLMPDMINHVALYFPKVRSICLGNIWSEEVLKDAKSTFKYFKQFYSSFIAARQIAEKANIVIFNTIINAHEIIRDRYCGGILVLTPNGKISPCVYVSSPQDVGYEQQIFGMVKNKHVEIDEEKIGVFWEYKAANNPKCQNCFARWNCGGGCPHTALYYTEEVQNTICEIMRQCLKKELLYKISKDFSIKHKIPLQKHLHDQLDCGEKND